MSKKIIFAIALLAVSLTVVHAQTQAQLERELEQIQARVMARGGQPTPQERQRVIETGTQMFMASGMSRTQAIEMAIMMANQMGQDLDSPNPNLTPEQQQMLAEQERLTSEYNQPAMPDMTPRMPGTEGWPASQAFRRYGANISKPSGTYVVSHERDSNNLTIHIWKNFVVRGIVGETTQNFTEAEVLAICRAFEPVFGATNDNGQIWRNEVTRVGRADRAIQDPQRRNTSTTRYSIYLTVDWDRRGQLRIEIKPTQGTITQ